MTNNLPDGAEELDPLDMITSLIRDKWSNPNENEEHLVIHTLTDVIDSQRGLIDSLQSSIYRVLELHSPFNIFDECDCEDKTTSEHRYIEDVGYTCNLWYTICRECCTSGPYHRYQTEECVDGHDHSQYYCHTVVVLDGDLT